MGLKQQRMLKSLTQSQVADIAGVKRSTVAMWENGNSKPRADVLIKLAAYFECSIDELLASEKHTA